MTPLASRLLQPGRETAQTHSKPGPRLPPRSPGPAYTPSPCPIHAGLAPCPARVFAFTRGRSRAGPHSSHPRKSETVAQLLHLQPCRGPASKHGSAPQLRAAAAGPAAPWTSFPAQAASKSRPRAPEAPPHVYRESASGVGREASVLCSGAVPAVGARLPFFALSVPLQGVSARSSRPLGRAGQGTVMAVMAGLWHPEHEASPTLLCSLALNWERGGPAACSVRVQKIPSRG